MGVRENKVEKYLDDQVKLIGGITRKWVSPGHDGVPDRIVFIDGRVYFIEVKTVDGKLSSAQKREHDRLTDHYDEVHTVYGEFGVDELVRNNLWEGDTFACGKPLPAKDGVANGNSGCGDMNCGPCNEFIYGE